SPISSSSSERRSGTKIPTSFSRMNVITPEKTITHAPASACQRNSVQLPWITPCLPGRLPAPPPAPMYSNPLAVGNTPASRPPTRPCQPVRIDHPQRVVHAPEDRRSREEPDSHPHERGGDDADRDRRPAGDEAGGGSDRDQPGDHSG